MDKLDEVLTCDDIWDDVFSQFDDPSDCLECFNLIMNELLDCLVPLKTLRVKRQDFPWLLSSSLTRACQLRDIAHCRALKSGSATDWSSYRALCNKTTCMLRSAKTAYFNGLVSSLSSKPSKFWRHFQCLSGHSKTTKSTQILATANDFNNHFLAIPHKTVVNVTSTVPATVFVEKIFKGKSVLSLMFAHVDAEIVSSVVTSLDLHKATGSDGLSAWFIRASPYMVRLIPVLLNKCIDSSSLSVEASCCDSCTKV